MTPADIEAIIALVQSHHKRGTLDSHGVYLLRNDLHDLNRQIQELEKRKVLAALGYPLKPLIKPRVPPEDK